jgi:hypothetical protein
MYAPADLAAMGRIRRSFDPAGRLNPGKLIPAAGRKGREDESRVEGTRT